MSSDRFAIFEQYSERIFLGGNPLTRYAHRGRRELIYSLVKDIAPKSVIDIGTADGWLLRDLIDRRYCSEAVGCDAAAEMVEIARSRSVSYPSLRFVLPEDLGSVVDTFDCSICLETLEHVQNQRDVLEIVFSKVAVGGYAIISVPIEVGLSLIAKQAGRWLANRKGAYGYERYTGREMLRAGILSDASGIERLNEYSHKGFDFRETRELIRGFGRIDKELFSPNLGLRGFLASTVIWIVKKTA